MTERRTDHLDPATIAALVDHTLEPAARAAAEAHLAACADCREVWVETSEMEAETRGITTSEQPRGATVVARPISRRSWIYGAAGLAAAAVIGISTWVSLRPPRLDRIVARLQPDTAANRLTEGRLSAPFPWKPAAPIYRGNDVTTPTAVQRSALELQEIAESSRTPEALRAAALGRLAVGDRAGAVSALRAAADVSTADASVHSDLAAALLEQWRYSQHAIDATRALDAAMQATRLDASYAPAQFNLALALEATGLTSQAERAWQRYLELDGNSAWSEEARRRIEELRKAGSTPSSSSIFADVETRLLAAWAHGDQSAPAGIAQAAMFLRGASADRGILTILNAIEESRTWPAHKQGCLRRAALAMTDWHIAFDEGRSEAAFRHSGEAVAALECAGLATIEADSRRSVSLIELNRYDEADALAGEVIRRARPTSYHRALARASQARALTAIQRGRFSDAVSRALESIDAAAAAGDVEFKAALETHVAGLFVRQGDVGRAWEHLHLAIAGERFTTAPRRRYAILARAAIGALDLRMPAAALAFADALVNRTIGWTNAVGLAFGHLKRAEALAQLGDVREGERTLREAERLIARIESPIVQADLRAEANLTAGLIAGGPAAALAALDSAVDYFRRTDNRIMLPGALLARGRSRLAAGRRADAETDFLDGVRLVEDQRPQIRDAQLRVSRLDRVWELFEELIAIRIDRPIEALAASERGRARQLLDALSSSQQLPPLDGPALYRWLGPDADALAYAALPNELLVWHLTSNGVRLSTRPVGRGELTEMIGEHVRALQQGRAPDPSISAILLPDGYSPGSQLFVFPDGPLHHAPFASLTVANGRYLGEQTEIVSGLSLTTTAVAQMRAAVTLRSVVALGSGGAHPALDLPALPSVTREMTSLATLYPQLRVLSDVSPESVLTGIRTADLFHFAGHAVADAVYPRRSRLILGSSESDALRAEQIAAATMRPGAIVILGACDTAFGQLYRGEGPLAISRSFLAAGAGAVVGSLWPLQDEGGSRFLAEFHQALAAAPSAARALAATQRAWIQRGEPAAVWSAFQVAGGSGRIRRIPLGTGDENAHD